MSEHNPFFRWAAWEATLMEIPTDKPGEMWSAEWVAMHMDFQFPEVIDPHFLGELKKLLIEVAGNRMYDYKAAEKVEELLIADGHTCPLMKAEASAESFTRYSKIKDYIQAQHAAICDMANEWKKQFLPPGDVPFDFSDILEREIRNHDLEYESRFSPHPWG